jgi:hypothetical protein
VPLCACGSRVVTRAGQLSYAIYIYICKGRYSCVSQVRRSAIRLILVTGFQLYIMAMCLFLSLYSITAFLDSPEPHTRSQTNKELTKVCLAYTCTRSFTSAQAIVPLMAMWVCLIFLHPLMLYYSQRYQVMLREAVLSLSAGVCADTRVALHHAVLRSAIVHEW